MSSMINLTRRAAFAFGGAALAAGATTNAASKSVPGATTNAASKSVPSSDGGADAILSTPPEAVVATRHGRVRGYRQASTYVFKGVPYGASTAGVGRFRPPTLPAAWEGDRLALSWGDSCRQAPTHRRHPVLDWVSEEINGFQSENCLNLNVWTPALDPAAMRPVLVWLHGGGFQTGSSREHPAYDGLNLSRRGSVVVSVNHRLGVLGFLDLSEAGAEFTSSGVVGMLDIVQALEWVRDNIERFGGDPSRVTVFGQSGGGGKVSSLMGMPAARGLFHRAVVMSGSYPASVSTTDARQTARRAAQAVGVTAGNAAALQAMDVGQLVDVVAAVGAGMTMPDPGSSGPQPLSWGPVLNGVDFTQDWNTGAPSLSANIPLMVGNVRDEFRDPGGRTVDEAALTATAAERFGDKGEAVIADLRKALPGAVSTDIAATLDGLSWRNMAFDQARKQAERGALVFSYWYVWATPILDGRIGVPHGADLVTFFDNVALEPALTGNAPRAVQLGAEMSAALVAFAESGRPDQPGLVWPAFDPATGQTMVFGDTTAAVNDPAGLARMLDPAAAH